METSDNSKKLWGMISPQERGSVTCSLVASFHFIVTWFSGLRLASARQTRRGGSSSEWRGAPPHFIAPQRLSGRGKSRNQHQNIKNTGTAQSPTPASRQT